MSYTITFVSRDAAATNALAGALTQHPGYKFAFSNQDINSADNLAYDVVVSPANSFGELKGGVDMRYYLHLGRDVLQNYVHQVIRQTHMGEILVGEHCLIDLSKVSALLDKELPASYMLMCPTMTLPQDVSQTRNAYYFTRAMIKGLNSMRKLGLKCDTVLCPIPCIGVGGMDFDIAAKQMEIAFQAAEGKGIVHAVYLGIGSKAHVDEMAKYYYMNVNDVMKNAKNMYVQMLNK